MPDPCWPQLGLAPENKFLVDFSEFARMIAVYDAANGYLANIAVTTSPGVPDLDQGTELWWLSLIDPDNRLPVSFPKRVRFLEELKTLQRQSAPNRLGELLGSWEDGRLKFWLTKYVLNFRRAHRELFERGEYIPVETEGQHRESSIHVAEPARSELPARTS
jgi:(1->4)-alpha-D-glucan 1-alpha-D-glucosylmutase